MLQRLEVIKDACQRKEVAFRLKVIEFHNFFGREAPLEASLVSVKLLSSRSGRDFWSKFKAWECISFGVDFKVFDDIILKLKQSKEVQPWLRRFWF